MSLSAEQVVELNERATSFYEAALQTPAGASALRYLRSRGIDERTMKRWRLGYAPSSGQALAGKLAGDGIGETGLLEAGLARSGARGASDFFRDRLMLPILDEQERVIAFGSRRLRDDDPANPKYMNSPETAAFVKSSTLYGMPNLAAAKGAEIFIVEGNLDMLLLWQNGVEAVVAAAGTAFSAEHLHLVAAVTERASLVLDADAAGQKATSRSLLLDGAERLDLGVIAISGAKDPAELLEKNGLAGWQSAMAGRIGRWDWLWQDLEQRHADGGVEALIARKNEWCHLVAQHAAGVEEAAALFARAEATLGLLTGMLQAEYGRGMAVTLSPTDELLLVALAANWPVRSEYLPWLSLSPAASTTTRRWQRAGAAKLGARLAAAGLAGEAEAEWTTRMMREIKPRLTEEMRSGSDLSRSVELTRLLRGLSAEPEGQP